jgi:inactivated superfamily I helicase
LQIPAQFCNRFPPRRNGWLNIQLQSRISPIDILTEYEYHVLRTDESAVEAVERDNVRLSRQTANCLRQCGNASAETDALLDVDTDEPQHRR